MSVWRRLASCGVVATGSCNRASGKTQWKCKCSNKRMKGRSHTVEELISMHSHKPNATSQPSLFANLHNLLAVSESQSGGMPRAVVNRWMLQHGDAACCREDAQLLLDAKDSKRILSSRRPRCSCQRRRAPRHRCAERKSAVNAHSCSLVTNGVSFIDWRVLKGVPWPAHETSGSNTGIQISSAPHGMMFRSSQRDHEKPHPKYVETRSNASDSHSYECGSRCKAGPGAASQHAISVFACQAASSCMVGIVQVRIRDGSSNQWRMLSKICRPVETIL